MAAPVGSVDDYVEMDGKPGLARTTLTWGLIALAAAMVVITSGGELLDDAPQLLLVTAGSLAMTYAVPFKQLTRRVHVAVVLFGYGCWMAAMLLLFKDWTLGLASGLVTPTYILLFLLYVRRVGRNKART